MAERRRLRLLTVGVRMNRGMLAVAAYGASLASAFPISAGPVWTQIKVQSSNLNVRHAFLLAVNPQISPLRIGRQDIACLA